MEVCKIINSDNKTIGYIKKKNLQNAEYTISTKILGSGVSGVVYKGTYLDLKIAAKIFRIEKKYMDIESKNLKIASKYFPSCVAKYYKSITCEIFDRDANLMPDCKYVIKILIMEIGITLYDYLETLLIENNINKYFEILRNSAEKCYIINKGFPHSSEHSILHGDIKSQNMIVTTRIPTAGICIDLDSCEFNHYKGFPPLDSFYLIIIELKSYGESKENLTYSNMDDILKLFKGLAQPYYNDILNTGIIDLQLRTQNNKNSTDPDFVKQYGRYNPMGLCTYNVEKEMDVLDLESTYISMYSTRTQE